MTEIRERIVSREQKRRELRSIIKHAKSVKVNSNEISAELLTKHAKVSKGDHTPMLQYRQVFFKTKR